MICVCIFNRWLLELNRGDFDFAWDFVITFDFSLVLFIYVFVYIFGVIYHSIVLAMANSRNALNILLWNMKQNRHISRINMDVEGQGHLYKAISR